MIEKYYRRIIDGLPTAVIVVDKNLRAVFANAKFRELFPSAARRGKLGKFFCCAENAENCGSAAVTAAATSPAKKRIMILISAFSGSHGSQGDGSATSKNSTVSELSTIYLTL